jgi:hypothetical protein
MCVKITDFEGNNGNLMKTIFTYCVVQSILHIPIFLLADQNVYRI